MIIILKNTLTIITLIRTFSHSFVTILALRNSSDVGPPSFPMHTFPIVFCTARECGSDDTCLEKSKITGTVV